MKNRFRMLVFSLLFTPLTQAFAFPVDSHAIRGAKLFQNYCATCHSVKYLEPTQEIPAFPAHQAPALLGISPPDLSLEVNVRGSHWVKAYLVGFYPDPKRPYGTNNRVYPDTAMPNMLIGLQSQMTPEEFDATTQDIVDFLSYASDPHQSERKHLGYWVIGFLFILAIVLFKLTRAFRDFK